MNVARIVPLVLAVASCSDSNGEDAGSSCPTHANPTFMLGTGNDQFSPITEGQDLQMERGPQGGCHLPLAFRTDGFAQRRFTVEYRISFADTGMEIINSRETRNLTSAGGGQCELLAFRAFLLEPWNAEDQRLRIEVDVQDDLGQSAESTVIIRAKWPDGDGTTPRENLCGARPITDAAVAD
jgi:hypothetical protein